MIKYYFYKIYFGIKNFFIRNKETISEIYPVLLGIGIPIGIILFFIILNNIRYHEYDKGYKESKEYKIEQACSKEGGLMWLGDCYKRGPKIKIIIKDYEAIIQE